MDKSKLIPVKEFCAGHNIGISFIDSLNEEGLVEITTIEQTGYIYESQLTELEKIIRLYFDININIEGIETVINLLDRINSLQEEITFLRNRLRIYESVDF
jgi:hypothetical protein